MTRLIAVTVVAALAIRLFGVIYGPILPPTESEASLAAVTPWRVVCAITSAAAAGMIVAALRSVGSRASVVAAWLAVLSPLSIAAAREAGPGAALEWIAAGLLWIALDRQRGTQWLAWTSVVIGAVGAVFLRESIPPASLDATISRWSIFDSELAGAALAFGHHAGFALIAVATGGLWHARGRPVAACGVVIAALTLALERGLPERLASLAGVGLAAVALAALAVQTLADRNRERRQRPPADLCLLLVLLAAQSPVLVSDASSGLRPPWRAALDGLGGPSTVPIWTNAPATVSRLLPQATIEPIPSGGPPPDGGAGDERLVVLAVESGRAIGSDPDLLQRIDARRLPERTFLARRFDLYRFEVRIYRF